MRQVFRLTFGSLLAIAFLHPAGLAQHTGDPTADGRSALEGNVAGPDGRLKGVRVLAYHLSTGRLFSSEPTANNGSFKIGDLPYGYFDLAVETPDGLFVASDVVNIAPSTKTELFFTLKRYQGQAEAEQPRRFPGSDATPSGWAGLREKVRGREFWRSPRGVALLAGSAAAILLLIASDSEDEPPATAFVP